jgi:hypothetical protein
MRIVLGNDHAGFPLKEHVRSVLERLGHEVLDVGTQGSDPVDFPDVAKAVSAPVRAGEADRGVLVCGTGVGAAIAANKIAGIRATVAHDTYTARQAVEHDPPEPGADRGRKPGAGRRRGVLVPAARAGAGRARRLLGVPCPFDPGRDGSAVAVRNVQSVDLICAEERNFPVLGG